MSPRAWAAAIDRIRDLPRLLAPVAARATGVPLWSEGIQDVFHLRTARGVEMDFVVEDDAGRIAAVE